MTYKKHKCLPFTAKKVNKNISLEFIELEDPKVQPIPCATNSTRFTPGNSEFAKCWSSKSIPLLSCISKQAARFKRQRVRKVIFAKGCKRNYSFYGLKSGNLESHLTVNERLSTLPIEEVEEESMLFDYWEKKEEYNEKYKKIMKELENEERTEIRCKISKLLDNKEINDTIQQIHEEYNMTRDLILKQKILEEEAILSQYGKIVFSNR